MSEVEHGHFQYSLSVYYIAVEESGVNAATQVYCRPNTAQPKQLTNTANIPPLTSRQQVYETVRQICNKFLAYPTSAGTRAEEGKAGPT